MHPCCTAPGHMSDILFITTASQPRPARCGADGQDARFVSWWTPSFRLICLSKLN
jgi:hypothetical protein